MRIYQLLRDRAASYRSDPEVIEALHNAGVTGLSTPTLAPGETTADGEITLRAVECLGGCSTPTIVAVDHRYRQSVTPEDVPAIVAELADE